MRPIIPMPFSGKDVPHLVIEVNQACNMSCKACYKNIQPYTKPIALIFEEIDYAVSQRNLDMITLAGGEPTLHPDLPRIIQYVTDRGVKASLLTNGLLLSDALLAACRAAGLCRVLVHVDSMQQRPDAPTGASELDLVPLRDEILGRVARHGIHGGLAVTLYRDNLHELPRLLDYIFASDLISLVLFTLCKGFGPIVERHGAASCKGRFDQELVDQEVSNEEVLELVEREFSMLPTHYIASNRRSSELRWLFYLAFVISDGAGPYHKLYLHGRYRRTITLANLAQKLTKGRYKFDMVPGAPEAISVCLAYALLGMDPRNLLHVVRFLAGLLRPGSKISSKVIVIQQPPNLTAEGGIEHCKNCPDATVRNGKVMPLCLADIISPIDGAGDGA